jgi:ribosomal protein S16
MRGLNEYVEPAWAAIRQSTSSNAELHGSAFLIPNDEADGLDRQEAGYNVVNVTFTSYDGEIVDNVGLYVPKKLYVEGDDEALPSYRYLKLLKDGAREGNLAKHWLDKLNSFEYYVTPTHIRNKTLQLISEFQSDATRSNELWSAEKLAKHDGSDPSNYPVCTSIMQYVIQTNPEKRIFPSWKGHNITRRNLLQFNGKSLDANDIRYDERGYRPLPKLCDCTDDEREYLMQSLEGQLHHGGRIVALYEPFLADQK